MVIHVRGYLWFKYKYVHKKIICQIVVEILVGGDFEKTRAFIKTMNMPPVTYMIENETPRDDSFFKTETVYCLMIALALLKAHICLLYSDQGTC